MSAGPAERLRRWLSGHYLPACVGRFTDVRGRRSLRHFHWAPQDFPLRVHVPHAPAGDTALLQAALDGIRSWERRAPELVRLQFVSEPPAAVAVEWVADLAGGRGGCCHYDVEVDEQGRVAMRVTDFCIAPRGYTAAQVARVAAHEFGHALGLGHSSSPADIMYPDFTGDGWEISAADVRTLRMLYALPSGAPASWVSRLYNEVWPEGEHENPG